MDPEANTTTPNVSQPAPAPAAAQAVPASTGNPTPAAPTAQSQVSANPVQQTDVTTQADPEPVASPTPVVQTQPAAAGPQSAEQSTAAPSILDRVRGGLRSNGTLVAENRQLTERAQTAEQQLEQVQGQLEQVQQDNARLQGELDQISQALDESENRANTVSAAAQEQVTALGVQPEVLPEASQASSDDTIEGLEAQMAASNDPAEKGRLAKKIRKMEEDED